jgi:hypothetical protein
MNASTKTKAILIVIAVLLIVYSLCNPDQVRWMLDWTGDGQRERPPRTESPELSEAELRGRLRAARQYGLELQSRLEAYNARFTCPEAELLDRAFLEPDGILALDPRRRDWYSMRTELGELLEKHRVYQNRLLLAESEIPGNPAKVREYWTLPERANAWGYSLDDVIARRARKLPTFTVIAKQLATLQRAQRKAQRRRKP